MRPVRSQQWLMVAFCGTEAKPLGITSIFESELPNMVEIFMSILHSKMVLKTSTFSPFRTKCPNIRHESIHLKNNLKPYFPKNWQVGWQDMGLAWCFPFAFEILLFFFLFLFLFLIFWSFFSTYVLRMGANMEYREVACGIINIVIGFIWQRQAGTLHLPYCVT